MARFDPKTAISRAKADPRQRHRPGAVWLIADQVIAWPESRAKPRGHEHRRVILLQDEELCRPGTGPATVIAIPCSSSGTGAAAPWDFLIPEGEKGFDKPRIIAYVSLVQPILKTDLDQYIDHVSKETLAEHRARAQWIMSIQRTAARLPERSAVQIPAGGREGPRDAPAPSPPRPSDGDDRQDP